MLESPQSPGTTPGLWHRSYSTIAFVGGAFALTLLAVVCLASMKRLAEYRAKVIHTHEVISNADRVLSLTKDAETGVRGYLLTGRNEFLEPYRDAIRDLHIELPKLQSKVIDNPPQEIATQALNAQIQKFLVALEDQRIAAAANTALTGEALDARIAASLGATKQQMDSVRTNIRTIVDAELRLLAERQVHAEWQEASTRWVVIITSAIGVVGLLMAAWLNGRHVRAIEGSRAELQQLNGSLEERILLRTHDLEQANQLSSNRAQELTAAYKDLESFSYSVSHDLKSPLRAIEGFSSLLTRKLTGVIDPDAFRQLEVIRTSAQHMGRLIADVLAFSRLGREAMKPMVVQLADLARQVLEERKPELTGRSVEVSIAPDLPPCTGDRMLLYQVISNLLGNAIKYSRQTTQAHIGLSWQAGATPHPATNQLPADRQVIVYRVSDDGIGFDMQYYDKMFGVFQRLHVGDTYEGTGIGLATVKRIIERHRGRVWAEGRPGAGSTFFFTIGELP